MEPNKEFYELCQVQNFYLCFKLKMIKEVDITNPIYFYYYSIHNVMCLMTR